MVSTVVRSALGGAAALPIILVAAAVGFPVPIHAQEQVYEIARLRAQLEVGPDGSYHIREEITYDFQSGSFTFARRDIPRTNSDGVSTVTVRSPDVDITALEQGRDGGSHTVRWEFPPSTGQVTFVLEYELTRALRELHGTNEVLWRVVGEGWEVPLREVEAEIVIPPAVPVSRSDVTLDPPEVASLGTEGDDLVARFLPGPLGPGQGYQVRVSFPRVMEGRAVGLARTETQATLAGTLGFALFLILGVVVAYRRLGPRFPNRRQTHPGMELPGAAVLLHKSPPAWDRAFPATLFQLADRGVISLERVDRKKGWFTTQEVVLHRKNAHEEPLSRFEESLLQELERYESLKDFATKGKKFRKRQMEEAREGLLGSGHLVDGRERAAPVAMLALATAVLAVIVFVAGAVFGSPWAMAAAGVGLGVAAGLAVVGSVRFPRSRQGAEKIAELKGYLEGVREELRQKVKVSPISAAEFLFSALPWLTLDPAYTGAEGRKLARLLKKETRELRVPSWAVDTTRAFERAAARHSTAYAAYLPFMNVSGATSGAVAPGAGGGVGGAAGGGAAGGGGEEPVRDASRPDHPS
ncbi:MAG: DUF2207 domain-containing protein [Gemmatimonadota bacterium]